MTIMGMRAPSKKQNLSERNMILMRKKIMKLFNILERRRFKIQHGTIVSGFF